jgi:hypothetical protein
LVAAAIMIHGLFFGNTGGGSGMSAGCPDSILVMSGAGPFGPIFHGV